MTGLGTEGVACSSAGEAESGLDLDLDTSGDRLPKGQRSTARVVTDSS